MLITISGLPGSGTTTVSRLVADALDLDRVPGGEVFRQLAAEAGMTLAEFGEHAQDHPEIDRELDDRLEARAPRGRLRDRVPAGRLAGHPGRPARRPGVGRLRRRRSGPPGWPSATARSRRAGPARTTPSASALEHARYQAVYDIDLDDRSPYDLVLDSTDADDLADRSSTGRRSSNERPLRDASPLDVGYCRAR